ncbi:MAG TPA: hypothetical protein VMD58_10320 [Acidobacteriaceae bacterium]|nr:hypothetical protein [Acidobacteriaceae bacterium]
MKWIFLLALLIAMYPTATAQQKSPISVSISTPSSTVGSKTDIRLDVTVTNISDHPIKLVKDLGPDGHAEAANDVLVYDSVGNTLLRIDGPVIKRNGQLYHLPKGYLSRRLITVDPGKSTEDFLLLNHLFDMTQPGKYIVLVRQEIPAFESIPNHEPRYIPSNTLTITVTQ